MSFLIRKGKKKDVKSIHKLIYELAVFEKLSNQVEITANDLIKDGFTKNPKFKTFVAEEFDGTIIGVSLFYERYSSWKGVTVHLEDLIVSEKKRGVGAGRELYKAVLKYAYDLGCKRVSWDVLDWNINAIKFYENTGAYIVKDMCVVHMDEEKLKKFIES